MVSPSRLLAWVDRRLLDVSESTVKRLVTSGELKAISIGASRRIPAEELRDFVRRQLGAGA